jgi:DsbC/DsbD-like thiol-disulfide interchange protein
MSNLLCWSLRFFCLIAGIALISAESAWAQEQDGKVLVTACLISDVNSIQPGQKFRIGVLYRIEPGWHHLLEVSWRCGHSHKNRVATPGRI